MNIISTVIYKPTLELREAKEDKWHDLQTRVIRKHIESGNTVRDTAKELGMNYHTFSNFMRSHKVQYSDKRYDIYKEWLK